MVNEEKRVELRRRVTELTCYLVVSARGLVGEPRIYGSSRLLEAARRLVELADGYGVCSEPLLRIGARIKEERTCRLLEGDAEFVELLDELVETLVISVTELEGSNGE